MFHSKEHRSILAIRLFSLLDVFTLDLCTETVLQKLLAKCRLHAFKELFFCSSATEPRCKGNHFILTTKTFCNFFSKKVHFFCFPPVFEMFWGVFPVPVGSYRGVPVRGAATSYRGVPCSGAVRIYAKVLRTAPEQAKPPSEARGEERSCRKKKEKKAVNKSAIGLFCHTKQLAVITSVNGCRCNHYIL